MLSKGKNEAKFVSLFNFLMTFFSSMPRIAYAICAIGSNEYYIHS